MAVGSAGLGYGGAGACLADGAGACLADGGQGPGVRRTETLLTGMGNA